MLSGAYRIILVAAVVAVTWINSVLGAADSTGKIYYYVAIPRCSEKRDFFAATCMRLGSENEVTHSAESAGGSKIPGFFSLWWPIPRLPIRTQVPRDASATNSASLLNNSRLPHAVLMLLDQVKRIRETSSEDVILQPLFRSETRQFWLNVNHLDALVTPTTASCEERTHRILLDLPKPFVAPAETKNPDVAEALRILLTDNSVPTKSIQYWPDYNILFIEAGSDFGLLAGGLFFVDGPVLK